MINFSPYLDRLEHFQFKGIGLNLSHCPSVDARAFGEKLQAILGKKAVHFVALAEPWVAINLKHCKHVVMMSDLDVDKLAKVASKLVNQVIIPARQRNIPVSFFDTLTVSAWHDESKALGTLLHQDTGTILEQLALEQFGQLLYWSNLNWHFIDKALTTAPLQTPLEQQLQTEFDARQLPYRRQVQLGRFCADFVLDMEPSPVVVECDHREAHASNRDQWREEEFRRSGYVTLRFGASEIRSNVRSCVDRILRRHLPSAQIPLIPLDRELDSSQKAAITPMDGPIRVLAPAGAGKTKTLTNRIVYLQNQGIAANHILALAFNKKAAREMRERLAAKGVRIAGSLKSDGVVIRTFHALGYEIIRDHLHWTYDEETATHEPMQLARQVVREACHVAPVHLAEAADLLLTRIQQVKTELIPLDARAIVEFEEGVYLLQPLFERFCALQSERRVLTFDDMIYLSLQALLNDASLRRELQQRFRYVLVDEFQDLNKSQLLFMHVLGLPQNNLFIVGDDDQMIYGWRGANIAHILDFPVNYPGSREFTLSTNYRSSKNLVWHSRWLIEHNQRRVAKDIQPKKQAQPGDFDVSKHASLFDQAKAAADWIRKQKQNSQSRWRDFAVLFRYHELQFPLAVIFDQLQVAHTPVNLRRLFCSAPGKLLGAYLQVVVDPDLATADDWQRLLRQPNRYLGSELIREVVDRESFVALCGRPSLEKWKQRSLATLAKQLVNVSESKAGISHAGELVRQLVDVFELKQFFQNNASSRHDIDTASDVMVLEVMATVAQAVPTAEALLELIRSTHVATGPAASLAAESEDEVTLSTIHATKGREFKYVVLLNLADSVDALSAADTEEERRVTYVALTRAAKSLLITVPQDGKLEHLRECLLNPEWSSRSAGEVDAWLRQERQRERVLIKREDELVRDLVRFFRIAPSAVDAASTATIEAQIKWAKVRQTFPVLTDSGSLFTSKQSRQFWPKGLASLRALMWRLSLREPASLQTIAAHRESLVNELFQLVTRDRIACADSLARLGAELKHRAFLDLDV